MYYLYKNIFTIFNNFWIRLSIIWRIIEIEEGVIWWGLHVWPRQITTSQNDKAKIFLQLYLHKFIFDSACLSASLGETCEGFFGVCKYSPNSRCRILSCVLALLGMLLANSLPVYSPWNEWKFMFCHFVFTTKTSQPCPTSSRLIIQ